MQRENIEEKIQDMIDGKLSDTEARTILEEIERDEYLRLLYTTLKEVDTSLHQQELSHPSENFTTKVMQGLHQSKPSPFDYRSLFIFLGIVICAAVGLVYASQASLSLPDIPSQSTEINIMQKLQINLPGIDLPSSEVFFNAFYFGLLFIALVYFDRVILRQIFRKRSYDAF